MILFVNWPLFVTIFNRYTPDCSPSTSRVIVWLPSVPLGWTDRMDFPWILKRWISLPWSKTLQLNNMKQNKILIIIVLNCVFITRLMGSFFSAWALHIIQIMNVYECKINISVTFDFPIVRNHLVVTAKFHIDTVVVLCCAGSKIIIMQCYPLNGL